MSFFRSEKLLYLLIFVILVYPSVGAIITHVPPGGDVFIGEEGLDISTGLGETPQIAYWAPGSSTSDQPDSTISVGTPTQFYVSPQLFVGKTGTWYRWSGQRGAAVFKVIDPAITIKVWDNTAGRDVTGKSVPAGNYLNFRVETNIYSVTSRPDAAGKGFVNIRVRDPYGSLYLALFESTTTAFPITNQAPNSDLWYWRLPANGNGWYTGVLDAFGNRIYNSSTYTVVAELDLNNIKNNYKAADGTDYTGKTISSTHTVNIGPSPTPTPTPSPTATLPENLLQLNPGWNFISIPRILADNYDTVDTVFSGVNTGGRSIFTYTSDSSGWKSLRNGDKVNILDGIWIYSVETMYISLAYSWQPQYSTPTKQLYTGWNAIGFSSTQPKQAKDTLNSIQDNWIQLFSYDSSLQYYETSIVKNGVGSHSDSNNMYPFKGYWVSMNGNGILNAIS